MYYSVIVLYLVMFVYLSDPVKLDTGISVNCASWNENGSLFAIGGAQVSEVFTYITQ